LTSIAIVGPGSIGAILAAVAQRAGHADVMLCGRTAVGHIVVERDGEPPVVLAQPVRTAPDEHDAGPADWVLVTVKAHQTGGAEPWLRRVVGPDTRVVVIRNGIEHRAAVEPLVAPAPVLPAIATSAAEPIAPGRFFMREQPRLIAPEGEPGRALAELLTPGGAIVDLSEDFDTVLWQKVCRSSVAALTVLTGRRLAIFRRADIHALAVALAQECVTVGRAEGARLSDTFAETLIAELAAMQPDKAPSIFFDRLAGRQLEWDARSAVICRLGRRHGIPTPVSDVVVPLLAAASDGEG